MADLRDRLREYADHLESSSTPTTATEAREAAGVLDLVDERELAVRGRRRRPARVLALAAALAVGAGIATFFLLQGEDSAIVQPEPADAGDTDAMVPVSTKGWERIPDVFEAGVWVAVSDGKAMYAFSQGQPDFIGCTGCPLEGPFRQPYGPGVWRSTDGREWEPLEQPSAQSARVQLVNDVLYEDGRFLAMGFDAQEQSDVEHHGEVWVSEDAVQWEEIPRIREVFDFANVFGVTAGPDGLVAVGADGGPAVWTSPDGRAWTRQELEGLSLFSGPVDLWDVAYGGAGYVAVGRENDSAAAWTSPDGETWERVDLGIPADAEGNEVEGRLWEAVPFGDEIVVSGAWDNGPSVWVVSPDGRWERIADDSFLPGTAPGGLWELAGSEAGLVASGQDPQNQEASALWVSGDGRAWGQVPYSAELFPDGSSVTDVVAFEDGFVAVGGSDAWVWTPSAP